MVHRIKTIIQTTKTFHCVAAASFAVLPALLTFGTSNTNYEHFFRPSPSNGFYDAMLVAVCISISVTEVLKQLWLYKLTSSKGGISSASQASEASSSSSSRLGDTQVPITGSLLVHEEETEKFLLTASTEPVDAFSVFEVLLALVLGTMSCLCGTWGSGTIWLAVATALLTCLAAASLQPAAGSTSTSESSTYTQQQQHPLHPQQRQVFTWGWRFQRSRSLAVWIYSAFLCLIAVAFIAFPVSQPWSGRPERFVRWHPFSTAGELVWRGIFAMYALTMLWAAAEDPLGKHLTFVWYLAVSGCAHSSVMLAMNLWEMAMGGVNGNREHLYGDVAGWYIVALASIAAIVIHRLQLNEDKALSSVGQPSGGQHLV